MFLFSPRKSDAKKKKFSSGHHFTFITGDKKSQWACNCGVFLSLLQEITCQIMETHILKSSCAHSHWVLYHTSSPSVTAAAFNKDVSRQSANLLPKMASYTNRGSLHSEGESWRDRRKVLQVVPDPLSFSAVASFQQSHVFDDSFSYVHPILHFALLA